MCVLLLKVSSIPPQVILNRAIPRKIKAAFFGHHVLKCLAQLLLSSAGDAGLHEVVSQLITDLATDTKLGVCFKSTTFVNNPEW